MTLKKQVASGLGWVLAQQFGKQSISFVISLILTRMLLPEEFGLIGMIAIFVSIGNVLLNAGLTQSLIRSKELDQIDYSTVFYFNLVASILIYIIIYFSAPFIAKFYSQPILIGIIRLYCLNFIISAFSAVQIARLTKIMDFKTQTIIAIPSAIIGGIVGVTLAYLEYGVWSLVWSVLSISLISSIQLWVYSKWTPSLVFNIEKFKEHFNFGYKLMFAALINTLHVNIYFLVIGKYFSVSQVGFYSRADTLKQLPVTNISSALEKVTFPLFSSIQDDNIRLKSIYKKLMQSVIYLIAPILIFLGVLAEPIFRFLFTEKWLPAVPYFQILCIVGVLYPINVYNLNLLKVKGRSDIVLKLSILKVTLSLIVIFTSLKFGIYGLLFGQVLLSIISFYINTFYTAKFIGYTFWQQIMDIIPSLFLAIICGFVMFFLDQYLKSIGQIDFMRILISGFAGSTLYILLSYFFEFNAFTAIKEIILKKNRAK
jgi:teichuronic acid exporter